jgi:ribosome biogenesis GTPase A
MQHLQWFPGHMTAAMRMMEENVKLVDGIMMILDARAPLASMNEKLNKLFSNKKILYVINKCDLISQSDAKRIISVLKAQGKRAVAVSAMDKKAVDLLYNEMFSLFSEKLQKNKEKGLFRPLRFMVAGIPNTGKSSFINKMAGRNRAKVADKPGVTRSNSWFAVGNGIELLDTPGVLWPKFDDPKVGDKLAFIGSVKDEILDSETLALKLINVLKNDYAERLTERFKITDFTDKEDYEILEMIGKKRGFLISGGEIDFERTSVILLDEYRAGKLGKLTLEYPREYE